jgi:LPS-assembly protein
MPRPPRLLAATLFATCAALCPLAPLAAQAAQPSPPQAPPPAPAAPATPPAEPMGPPAELANRINFNLNFPKERGGGSAVGSAAALEYLRQDHAVLTGDVHVKYQDMDIYADRAEIDLTTKAVTAEGNVIVDQGPRRMTGTTLTWDLDTKTGRLENATAQVTPDYYFTGKVIEKTGIDTYEVEDGVFTSCTQDVPDWSFRMARAEVQAEAYARIHHTSMRVKRLPVLYTPYILWPTKTERTSGLLVPNIGYSQSRGGLFGLAYYQVLGRSYDTTFHLDAYSKSYLGVGDEFRYHPTEGTLGDFVGYAIKDPVQNRERWKVNINHVTDDLPFGMRGVVSLLRFSDFNFPRDFERDFSINTLRSVYSKGFLTGNWGPHLFNFLVDDRQTLVGFTPSGNFNVTEQRRLPEAEYRLRSTELGHSNLYLQVQSKLDQLDVAQTGLGSYGRADLFPQLTFPIHSFPWLSASITGGERLTWYGDSLDRATVSHFTGQSLTRVLPTASLEVVGPSFSRIFSWDLGSFGKFKHVIEPRWTYNYQGEFNHPEQILQFDEVDPTPKLGTSLGRLALDNRVLGKPANEENASAREILFFEIARNYSFDATQPQQATPDLKRRSLAGPLETQLRFNPSTTTSIDARASYDTLFSHLDSTSFSGNLTLGKSSFALTWFTNYQPQLGKTLSDQVRFSTALHFWDQKIGVQAGLAYDLQLKIWQDQRYVITYNAQCYGLNLELRQFQSLDPSVASGLRRDRDIRFSLSLKNVGTFLDLTGRSSSAVQ